MNNPLILESETLEDLQLNNLKLLQKRDGFKFGMDSVLLAEFACIRKQDLVADFGTGSGILPLLLTGREKGSRYIGIEIQKNMAEMAERTVLLNHLENSIRIIHGDAAYAAEWISPCSVDAVICNPPYGQPGTVISSPFESRAIARNQNENTLKGFFSSAFKILKGKGRISLVYPAPQMLLIMKLLQDYHLEPKRFQMVYPFENKPANLVLIEAVKDAKPTLHPMEPLIIYKADHQLTNRLKSIYHIEENPV